MSFLNPKKSIFFAIGILFFGLTLNAYAANPVPGSATLPQGGSSPTNNVTYNYSPDGKTLNQNSTGNSISNFGSMSVGAGYTWNINQPSSGSTSLNRCFNCDQSIFNGPINSNGRIIFVNNNGIIFGRGSVVNAPSIIASTLDISDTDFLNGNYKFFKNGGNSFIINQGRISAQPGGFVALLSQAVNNQGVILADSGSIALASGNKMTVALDTLNQISVTVDEAVQSEVIGPDGQQIKSAINNSGTIQANGGKVLLTAKVMNDVFDYAVNNTGVITAGALVNNGGVVEITASGAPVVNTGSITANAVNINVQNANLVNNASIVASLLQGQANTGNISINALNIFQAGLIAADAEVDVTAVEAIEATDPIGDSTPSSPSPVSNLIKGNDVNLVASQFGSPDVPLNIDANNIDITLVQGNINIGSSLVANSAVNLRAPPTGPPTGIVSISYNSDANLVLNASTGSINVAPQAEVSANNLTLTAQDGIYSYGSLTATNTLTLLSPAGIYSLGSLQSADLYERGATFQVGGIFNPGYADVKNADNAMEFSADTDVSGTVTDGTDIIIDAGVTLTMTADISFVANTGAFTMDPTSTIVGGGFNLSISALSASTLGNISGVNLLTLSAVSSSPVTFT